MLYCIFTNKCPWGVDIFQKGAVGGGAFIRGEIFSTKKKKKKKKQKIHFDAKVE